jgi:hypothetical protein
MRWYLELVKRHNTVVSAGAVIVGKAAGLIVIILETGVKHDHNCLLQSSFITVPPHAFGVAEKVERFEVPLIKQPPVNP